MTDPIPPYELDEVVVRGQRRRPGGAFPAGPGGGGGAGDGGGEYQNEVGENDPPPDQVDPCADPETRREWDRDAAAASARKKMEAAALAAGEDGLTHRERACWLLRQPDGSIIASEPIEGDTFQPGVTPTTFMDPYQVSDMSRIVGIVHNHGPGFHGPSSPSGAYGGDAAALATLQNIMNTYPVNNGWQARLYIVAKTEGADSYNKINVYGPENISSGTVPEVNPDADLQACPAN
jgi:hypothetical protein